jgi:hypothetical protein
MGPINAIWGDQRNPVNPRNPDETSVSVACPSGRTSEIYKNRSTADL